MDSPGIKMDSDEILLMKYCVFVFPFDLVKTCQY